MTQRWDASNVPETVQRLGAQLTVSAYFAVPVTEPPLDSRGRARSATHDESH